MWIALSNKFCPWVSTGPKCVLRNLTAMRTKLKAKLQDVQPQQLPCFMCCLSEVVCRQSSNAGRFAVDKIIEFAWGWPWGW